MQYLEQQQIIHRDLALRNLLVTVHDEHKYLVKVADFGLSRSVDKGYYQSNDKTIPYRWCAPEIFDQGVYTAKSDVWAFGVMLWELFSYGAMPYAGITNAEVVE